MENMMKIHKQLEDKIEKRFDLSPRSMHDENIVAFMVEIGELANETKCFKYWSADKSIKRARVLEEYADLCHVLIGLGNAIGAKPFEPKRLQENSLTQQFITLYDITLKHHWLQEERTWTSLVNATIGLGFLLHFTEEEVENAFKQKHELNMKRQESDY